MKFNIFFIYLPLVHSERHRFMTTYTGINGTTIAGIPEFSAVTTLDDQQMDYYDSNIMELIPRKNWMKDFASTHMWKQDTKIRKHVQQIYKNNIHVVMERFSQSHGVHTYQRMYGCDWDDKTEVLHVFDQYGYDGEDFISLDLKQLRYITPVPQGLSTVQKWNNNRIQLESLKQYYEDECVYWLKEFLTLGKADLEKKIGLTETSDFNKNILICVLKMNEGLTGVERHEAPQVSLLQKDPSSPLGCHATGFYPSRVTITWLRNGVDHHEDVDLGELLPNEDETFQKTSYLRITPDAWKKNQYTCVVEHMGETIKRILTEDEIKSNNRPKPYFTILVCVITVLVIGAAVWIIHKKRLSRYYKFKPVPCESEEEVYIDKGL